MSLQRTTLDGMRAYLELTKVRIAVFSAFSAGAGFVLAAPHWDEKLFILMVGIFVMASGASGLNQYQDRDIDALMERTRSRPLPSGKVAPLQVLRFSLLLIALGSLILPMSSGPASALLGLSAVVWYNGVYTRLKRRSAFAVIPGALVGAFPPAIGWIAAGGSPASAQLLSLCFFFYLWQVPHFWLLLLRYSEEYEKAGLPSLSRVFGRRHLSLITFQWVCAASVTCLLLVLFRVTASPAGSVALFGLSAVLLWNSLPLLREKEASFSMVFSKINCYMFLVLLFLVIDRLDLLSDFQEVYTMTLMTNN